MHPMDKDWSNGFVFQSAHDIRIRGFLTEDLARRLEEGFKELNRAINFIRVETPCIVPERIVEQHQSAEFPVWEVGHEQFVGKLFLRPETTKGTYTAIQMLFPQASLLKKQLPVCVWQSGKSFRVEQDKAFRNLRFKEFYQLEFQLVYSEGTAADYHVAAVEVIQDILFRIYGRRRIRAIVVEDDRPFYSTKTTDIYLDDHEIVAISNRTDFEHPVLEVACGLDRLVALYDRVIE